MKILMVTRETRADQRYGLGRSLAPLLEELRHRGIAADYLCQADLGQRALLWQRRCHSIGSFLLGKWPARTNFSALLQVLLERFNMGRLAAKLSVSQQYTHVHCHDPLIAAGLAFFFAFSPQPPHRLGRHRAWLRLLCASNPRRRRSHEPANHGHHAPLGSMHIARRILGDRADPPVSESDRR